MYGEAASSKPQRCVALHIWQVVWPWHVEIGFPCIEQYHLYLFNDVSAGEVFGIFRSYIPRIFEALEVSWKASFQRVGGG